MAKLGSKHHAMFFAWAVEEIFNYATRDEAELIIREAVVQYGNERGKRMALRAKQNGRVLDMTAFLEYVEWLAEPGDADWLTEVKNGDTYTKVLKCPWFTAWKNNNVIEYGKYYCKYIDDAVKKGFNPDLKVEVKSTLSEGRDYCEFIFYDGVREDCSLSYTMPWEYHIAHLVNTLKETLSDFLMEQSAIRVMYNAINKFRHEFGDEACMKIIKYEGTDFSAA
jgi:hypothetical protein